MKRKLKCIFFKLCAAIWQDFGHSKNRLKAHTIENSCQTKFGLFDQFTWQKRSEDSYSTALTKEIYFSIYYAIYKALVFCATMTTPAVHSMYYILSILCIVTASVLQANSAGNYSGIRAGWAIQWRGEYENEDNSHPL